MDIHPSIPYDPAVATTAQIVQTVESLCDHLLRAQTAHAAAGSALDLIELTKGIRGKRAVELEAAIAALGTERANMIATALRAGHAALQMVTFRPEGISLH